MENKDILSQPANKRKQIISRRKVTLYLIYGTITSNHIVLFRNILYNVRKALNRYTMPDAGR